MKLTKSVYKFIETESKTDSLEHCALKHKRIYILPLKELRLDYGEDLAFVSLSAIDPSL